MLEIASQIILCLTIAALLGFIIGYLLGKSSCKKSSCTTVDTASYAPHKEVLKEDSSHAKQNFVSNETKGAKTTSSSTHKKSTSAPKSVVKSATKATKKTATASSSVKGSKNSENKTAKATKSSSSNKVDASASKTVAKKASSAKTVASNKVSNTEGTKPATLTTPKGGKKDNLSRIKGIGSNIEEALNKTGIYHYDQIANWGEKDITWIDSNLKFSGRVKKDDWIAQAKLLSAGKETEFSKRVDAGKVSSSKKS